MELVSDLVQFLITSFLILKSCIGVRNYSTEGSLHVSRRKFLGLLRLSFHQGNDAGHSVGHFSNSTAMGASLLNDCQLTE